MDRPEQTGLGLAFIGHLGLLAALSVALVSKQDMPKLDAEPLTVELIDDSAAGLTPMSPAPSPEPDAQSAPLPSDAPPAPPEISAAEVAAQKAAQAAEAKAAAVAIASQKAAAEAAQRAKAAADVARKSQADAAAKLAAQKAAADAKLAKQRADAAKVAAQKAEVQRRAKAEAERKSQQTAANAAAAKVVAAKAAAAKAAKEKAAREAASKAGKGGTGLREIKLGGDDKPKGNAMSTAQAQQVVDTSLATAIQPRFKRCAPTGVDVELIITRIQISLNRDGSVANVGVLGQTGINDSNQPQAELLKSCAIKAVRTAAPFTSLPVAHYDLWKSMTKRLKTR